MRLYLIALVVFTISGCAPNWHQVDKELEALKGKTREQLFSQLGFPDDRMKLDDKTIYRWVTSSQSVSTDYVPSQGQLGTSSFEPSYFKSGEATDLRCILNVAVTEDDIVTDYSYRGNWGACKRYRNLDIQR